MLLLDLRPPPSQSLATYPLALAVTRLQVQRQSKGLERCEGTNTYVSIPDALVKIYNANGASALFQGADAATIKTMADSFLFFLGYNFLRQSRLYYSTPGRSSSVEELKVGFLAGAFAKLLTTPISNVVTRKQVNSPPGHKAGDATSAKSIARTIYQEKGVQGFWSGYSASLILTFNPSLTFYFYDILKKLLLSRENRAKPSPRATFFLAALSKAMASSITYPFSLAKTRLQISRPKGKGGDIKGRSPRGSNNLFSIVWQIVQQEGVRGLFDGVQGEVAKGFLSHGITMLTKDIIHGMIIQIYYFLLKLMRRYPKPRDLALATAEKAMQKLNA